MKVQVQFYSYYRDLAGTADWTVELPEGATLEALAAHVEAAFPRLREVRKSTLMAVGVEYQPRDYRLREGDVASFFPPVQGG